MADHRVASFGHGELEHLACHRGAEPVHPRRTVLHLQHSAYFLRVECLKVGGLDFFEQNILELTCAEDRFGSHGPFSMILEVNAERLCEEYHNHPTPHHPTTQDRP